MLVASIPRALECLSREPPCARHDRAEDPSCHRDLADGVDGIGDLCRARPLDRAGRDRRGAPRAADGARRAPARLAAHRQRRSGRDPLARDPCAGAPSARSIRSRPPERRAIRSSTRSSRSWTPCGSVARATGRSPQRSSARVFESGLHECQRMGPGLDAGVPFLARSTPKRFAASLSAASTFLISVASSVPGGPSGILPTGVG